GVRAGARARRRQRRALRDLRDPGWAGRRHRERGRGAAGGQGRPRDRHQLRPLRRGRARVLRAARRARGREQPTDRAPGARGVPLAPTRAGTATVSDADLLVLGSGVGGLSAAVRAARAGLSVVVVTKGELGWSATRYAQGGVAAALDGDGDSPELHGSDTLAAG